MGRNIMKNVIITVLIIVLIGVTSLLVFQKGIGAETTYQYGIVSDSSVPKQFETVQLTIDAISEDGDKGTQTFTFNTVDFTQPYVKLHIKRDKIVTYEFIEKKDVPKKIVNELED